ncbi:MAG: pantetheine-phosphate adenylyltransferase [Omnitrophica bacterium RIFCSPLOWO2_12_FULL_50_11]|nr:MAG: pantetheine-phosphate adenylyltransferase [Omnitrophica bacterium RIFCSPLOWO2_12_FULL_50_11]
MKKKRRALYPGSFDPVTYGHLDLIDRALELFDEVHVAVAVNTDKRPLFSAQERVNFIKRTIGKKRGMSVGAFTGLIVDYARQLNVGTIIRGVRATSDFEYEFQMALTNRKLSGHIDTLFLMPSEKHFYLSSRLIKEIARWGGDVSDFVPPFVRRALVRQWS